jgi:hypothetical protein
VEDTVKIPLNDAAPEAPASRFFERRTDPSAPAGPVMPAEIECPLTGEIVRLSDADGLIDLFERVKRTGDICYAVQMKCREALAAMSEGDTKTRRVRGRRRLAKITMPDDAWENSLLMEAFNSYPQYRDQCLRIERIKVMLRDYKKVVGTAGPPDFEQFRNMVSKANRGPCGTPVVTVEA